MICARIQGSHPCRIASGCRTKLPSQLYQRRSATKLLSIDAIKLVLTVISGLCWTIVYIEGIRIGFRDRTYAIPFYALALNIAWELLHTFFGFRRDISVQTIVNAVWFLFDVGILYTYFKFGRKYFPRYFPAFGFIAWSILVLLTALVVEYAFIREFGVAKGAGYSAFLQNLLMSVLFITMFVSRGGSAGQSLAIAVSKWIGTLAPTIQFGILGDGGFPNGSFLIMVAGGFCSVFDLVYIRMLLVAMRPNRSHSYSTPTGLTVIS